MFIPELGSEIHDVPIHIDGARLFEAVAAGAGSLRDFAQCAGVVTLDFSKNLGAPMGAMALGSQDAIRRLKRIRKAMGGGMRQAGVLTAAARQAVVEHFGMGELDTVGTLVKSHDMARKFGKLWTEKGGRLLRDVETNMVWVDLKAVGVEEKYWNDIGRRHGILLDGRRIVFHHQTSEEALKKLESVIKVALPGKRIPVDVAASLQRSTWISQSMVAKL